MYSQDSLPTIAQLEEELQRIRHRKLYYKTIRSTVYVLIIVAAIAVLVATMVLPVLDLSGSSMEPTLNNGDKVIALKSKKYKTSDIVAFYYNNKILIKRVIGSSGDIIDIKDDGTVYVNGVEIQEPYITDKSLGNCDISFPYQVPENRIFVMGDHRKTSVDSRISAVGSIELDDVVGKVVFRAWPLRAWGIIR